MNVSEALDKIRTKIHDDDTIAMTDEELLTCLNEAIQYVASYLVGAKSPVMAHDMVIVAEETTLPQNFVKPAGVYPVKITGNTLKWLDYEAGQTMKLRYFSTPTPATAEGTMPFVHDALLQITIKLAAIYAGNELEAEISQDKALLDEVNALLAQAAGNGIPQAGGAT